MGNPYVPGRAADSAASISAPSVANRASAAGNSPTGMTRGSNVTPRIFVNGRISVAVDLRRAVDPLNDLARAHVAGLIR